MDAAAVAPTQDGAAEPLAVAPMRPWRAWLAMAVVAVLLVGHAVDIIGQREHWPFSNYPMYARTERKPRQEILSLFGVMRAPGYHAMVRITDPRYVPPLSEGRLRVILMSAYRRGTSERNIADAKRVMADYMRAYESRRAAGLHDGPRMTEIHLYRLTWRLRPDGTPRTRPSKSEPLLKLTWEEVEQPARPPEVRPPPTDEE